MWDQNGELVGHDTDGRRDSRNLNVTSSRFPLCPCRGLPLSRSVCQSTWHTCLPPCCRYVACKAAAIPPGSCQSIPGTHTSARWRVCLSAHF